MITFLLLFSCASISIIWFSLYYGISPTPSSKKCVKKIIDILPLQSGKVVDLGSGWGHLVVPLAKHKKNLDIEGLEISYIPHLISHLIQAVYRFKNLKLRRQNFFQVNLQGVDGVICYLYPKAMEKLKIKFEKELKPGCFIISNTFAIPGWTPKKVFTTKTLFKTPIYLYEIEIDCPKTP